MGSFYLVIVAGFLSPKGFWGRSEDARYDRGKGSFRLKKWFLNDGAPEPKIVGNRPFLHFLHDSRCVHRPDEIVHSVQVAVYFSLYKPVFWQGSQAPKMRKTSKERKWCALLS